MLTADHGVSFRVEPTPAPPFVPGKLGYRRDLTQENAQDIVTIPLFIKYPGQAGATSTPSGRGRSTCCRRSPTCWASSCRSGRRQLAAQAAAGARDDHGPQDERRDVKSTSRRCSSARTRRWPTSSRYWERRGTPPTASARTASSSAGPSAGLPALEPAGRWRRTSRMPASSPTSIPARASPPRRGRHHPRRRSRGPSTRVRLNGNIVSVGMSFGDIGAQPPQLRVDAAAQRDPRRRQQAWSSTTSPGRQSGLGLVPIGSAEAVPERGACLAGGGLQAPGCPGDDEVARVAGLACGLLGRLAAAADHRHARPLLDRRGPVGRDRQAPARPTSRPAAPGRLAAAVLPAAGRLDADRGRRRGPDPRPVAGLRAAHGPGVVRRRPRAVLRARRLVRRRDRGGAPVPELLRAGDADVHAGRPAVDASRRRLRAGLRPGPPRLAVGVRAVERRR